MEEQTGQPIRTLENVKDVHEPLDIEYRTNKTYVLLKYHNKLIAFTTWVILIQKCESSRLPEWTREVFIPGGALEYLKTYWIKFITGTPELKRLKSGFLLKEILDRFKNKTLSSLPDELMRIYSGHDITIASLLNTLDVFEVFF